MKKSELILTVPHAVCLGGKRAKCDSFAEFAARYISRYVKPRLFVGDINRSVIDLNRFASRNTAFRKKIEATLKRSALLVDVHSYKWDKSNHFFRPGEAKTEVVLLSFYPILAAALADRLQSRGISVKIAEPWKIDDIIIQATEHNVPSFLIEFYYALQYDRDRAIFVLRVVADVLQQMVQALIA